MLVGELIFYKGDEVIKNLGDEEFSELNAEQLSDFVRAIANEIGATKVVSDCVYHGGANGSIKTTLFVAENTIA